MTDWADAMDSPEAKALLRQERTAKARQARRRNVLERKADEYAAALRELGYGVYEPSIAPTVSALIAEHIGDDRCPLCSGVNGHAVICDDYGRESAKGFCAGCPDHEACSQSGCHLDGGPVKPEGEYPYQDGMSEGMGS